MYRPLQGIPAHSMGKSVSWAQAGVAAAPASCQSTPPASSSTCVMRIPV